MARPTRGAWVRNNSVHQASTNVWGTGINPVHSHYGGGPPLRVKGRLPADHTPPGEALPDSIEQRQRWGYTSDDQDYTPCYLQYDGRPRVGVDTQNWRGNAGKQPPLNATGAEKSVFRSLFDGARRLNDKGMESFPSETVNEGWLNKPHGEIANALVSDPSQYEMQTSMRQRYQVRNNANAVARGTDVPREPIESRVVGQKLKVYSGEERHIDMFPYQQDDMPRAFYFRTAGTGNPSDMEVNEMYVSEPIQRVPGPDPDLGPEATDIVGGYTAEDNFYV